MPSFSIINKFQDDVESDVSMDACHLLLGRPCRYGSTKQLILMGKETPTTSIRDCNITFFYPMKEKVPPKLAKPQVHSLFATKISLKRVNK
jgi:hypothetical protein